MKAYSFVLKEGYSPSLILKVIKKHSKGLYRQVMNGEVSMNDAIKELGNIRKEKNGYKVVDLLGKGIDVTGNHEYIGNPFNGTIKKVIETPPNMDDIRKAVHQNLPELHGRGFNDAMSSIRSWRADPLKGNQWRVVGSDTYIT